MAECPEHPGQPLGYVLTLPVHPAFVVAVEPSGQTHILGHIPRQIVIETLREIVKALDSGHGDIIIPGGGRG